MLLTADIGNTNIVLALLDEKDRVVSQCRVPSGEPLPPEAYDNAIRRVLEGQAAPEGAVIGSVVPRLTAETAHAIRRVTGLEALVVGHHGSKYSTSEALLSTLTPELAFISVGDNSYGHPSQETLERLRRVGADIWRTDEQGTVCITVNGGD